MPNLAERDRMSDEIARQLAILWRERWARLLLTSIPYGLGLLFLPVHQILILALINLITEILYMHLLRGMAPDRDKSRYLLSKVCVFFIELSFSATAALIWHSSSDFAKPFAVGMLCTTLLHLATVRAIHLPHGFIGLAAVFVAAQSSSLVYWSAQHNWAGFAVAFLAVAGGIGYAFTAMISNHRLHSSMAEKSIAAEAADAAKTRFLAQMSHELRTPLNAIVGLGTYEAGQAKEPESQQRLKMLVASAKDLTILLDDILDLSAIGEGKVALRPSVIDARTEIETAVGLFAMQAQETSTTLHLAFADDFPRFVITDPQRLRQCVTNLVSNALKHAANGTTTLTAKLEQSEKLMLIIDVSDDGPGVGASERDLIFLPFHKAMPIKSGTGLGLAISRSIARQMGGDLTLVDSNAGAHFRLALTVGTAPFGYEPRPLLAPDLTGRRILVVDDVGTNRIVAKTLLSQTGVEVSEASTGEEALNLIKAGRFDLVMMDINMPDMDGLETFRRIRNMQDEAANMPVLAMTAETFDDQRQRYLDHGLDGCITKPLDPEILLTTLRLHLRVKSP